jgi:hypothetical protein
MKQLLLIPFILLLFTGSVGIDVFKHICSKEGVSVAFVFNTVDHCEEESKDIPSCCKDEQSKDDCCDDEVDLILIDLDFFQKQLDWDFSLLQMEAIISANWQPLMLPVKKESFRFSDYYPPPPKNSSTQRALLQVYTI